jgi:hypothetical protein
MMYELWHLTSRNLLEDFETEAEALDAVREYVAANDAGILRELSLSAVPTSASEAGRALPPTLAGQALAERVGLSQWGRESAGAVIGGGIIDAHGATDVREYRRGKRIH